MPTDPVVLLETRAPSQVVALTGRVTEALPVGATGRNCCIFLEIPLWNAFVDAFELGAVSRGEAAVVLLPEVIVQECVVGLVGVLVAGGASEAKYGRNPGVGVETRSEPTSAAEPGPDVFGCGGDHHKLSPESELRNSRALLVAELPFACEVEHERAPPNIQREPTEVLTGATVVERCWLDGLVTLVLEPSAEDMLGKWDVAAGARLGCVVLVWVSRAGQETGPGRNLVGKTVVAFLRAAAGRQLRWRRPPESSEGFGPEKNGPSTEL